ncbi:metalloregulator ArsR/SmtB family transcription factor [Tistrella mobilis]|uniref:ArsR/SmtB family transcription factor n=1 Tax=Tistrella mobilis TaxID=171437 RepID=UPI003558F467
MGSLPAVDGPHETATVAAMDTLLDGLKAAAEPTRLRLLALLSAGELTVTELTQILGQSQPRVSRHLKLMCEAGLLDRIPEGAWVFYRLAREGAAAGLARRLVELLPLDDPALAVDLGRLRRVKEDRARQAEAYFRANAAEWRRIRALHVPEAQVEAALSGLIRTAGPRSLLDIGTGTGRILDLLGPLVDFGLGIDRSREMLAVAREQLASSGLDHCQVRLGDLNQLPVTDAAFDAVVIHQVLHYLDDPGHALAEAARVLRPGGMMVVVDFAAHTLEDLRRDHAHRRLGFSDDEVEGWLAAAGLEAETPIRLPGEPLTVVLWPARRTGGAAGSGEDETLRRAAAGRRTGHKNRETT